MYKKRIQKNENKKGRPLLDSENRKSYRAVIYLSEQEYKVLKIKSGINSISSYIRERLFGVWEN